MIRAWRNTDGLAHPVPVLLYHDVSDAPLPGQEFWTVGPAAFQRHMALVAASGRKPSTMSQYAQSLGIDRPTDQAEGPVLVTFDDGYASWVKAVATMATEGVCSATCYVTTAQRDALGMASWSDLAALPDWVEIGAHSVSHPQLDVISISAVRREVTESREACEQFSGRPCRSFAYPQGFHTGPVRQAVVEAGYTSAAAVKNALSHNRDDPFAVARMTITADMTDERVVALLHGHGAPLAWSRERLRTRGFRAYRRVRRSVGRGRSSCS
jgi:peptidoglycan/xylan/chitin deacetylase (PgdA/CDA1 family)